MGKRSNLVDLIKGIAIVLVIYGHVLQYFTAKLLDFFEIPMFKFTYSFHMPLFMIVSGYLFFSSIQEQGTWFIIERKIKTLFIPAFIWGGVFYSFTLFLEKRIEAFSVNELIDNVTGVWFVYSVFINSILILLAYKKRGMKLIVILLAPLLFVFIPNSTLLIFMYPFFLIGYLYHKHERRLHVIEEKLEEIALILFPIMLLHFGRRDYIYTSKINPFTSSYGITLQIIINIFRWGIGLCGSLVVIHFARVLIKMNRGKFLLDKLERLGQKTLEIYVIQRVVIENIIAKSMNQGFQKFIFADHIILFSFIIAPILTMTILFLIFFIIEKIYKYNKIYSILFGKKTFVN